ncbi:MAG: hypothetical protein LKE46_02650 [Clostridium sp.]|jgi:hypothetical protein|uniref:hypothetical protein n=1 Tax=Clostridium sp. TaxID=1506 RepID=UPI0025BD2FE1|nr:hypothetical protein [Clostridium sp.]MCH3963147.1 hypothetical protein [Clostridium sp.]MCI1716390.1 hypothetical protein [Clostridium sp.]MCI1800730.1 hypothetical protein [Clostridium sp.]MCI1814615.1 hypothetical protein [Clostridium sp.]MCI1871525.1 hypothetical protein [Clostridium sp.]
MLKIQDKALNYVKGRNLCFVTSVKNTSVDCDCGNVHNNVKIIKIKVVFETEVRDKELYNIYEYNGIKLFVLKTLKVTDNINVYQKPKLLFMKPRFGLKGVTA